MICEQGAVVVVPFPFVDRPIVKRRPALVCSREAFNGDNGHSVMAMITTAAHSTWPSDIAIHDLTSAGLTHASVVRWKVFTLPNDLIQRQAGRLSEGDRANVLAFVHHAFGPE